MLEHDNHHGKRCVHTHQCLCTYPRGRENTIERLTNRSQESRRKHKEKANVLENGELGRDWGHSMTNQEGQHPNNDNTQQKENKQKEEITQDDFPELSTEWGEAHTADENKPTLCGLQIPEEPRGS